MKKTIITIAVLVVAIVAAAFVLKGNKADMQEKTELAKKVNATVPVQVAQANEESLSGSFTVTGNFQPSKEITIASEASGKIVSVLVKEGQFVREGQVLAQLEHETLAAEVRSAEVSLQKIKTDKTRYENLIQTGGVSQSQVDDINMNFVTAESRLISAKKRLSDAIIKAPFNGYINKKYIEVGSYLSQQSNKVFDIVDLSKLKMVVNATEAQVLAVSNAKAVTVEADVYPGTTYEAKINFIGAKADAALNYPVELEITNIINKPLRGGMFGRASFALPTEKPALVIPRTAVIGSVNDAQVFVVEGDVVKTKKFVAGRQFANQVEVLSGLSAGETVVVSGQINLSEGTKVSVLK